MAIEDIRTFVVSLLRRKGDLPPGFDDSTDFIADGIVDSIGIIKFVLEIESRFGIEILDADIEAGQFRTVRGLTAMIAAKLANNS
jgi:D-alanine--poly(phosphoribitol) ligase subunit 2